MAEIVVIRQKANFETIMLAPDPHEEDSEELHQVASIYDLTPYGMLLASIGACTAILLHSYAQNHKMDLQEVELSLTYERVFEDDCENCETIEAYEEQIREKIRFMGKLNEKDQKKLFAVSHQCPVHRMVEDGIHIDSSLDATAGEAKA